MSDTKEDISKAISIAEKTFRECGIIPHDNIADLSLDSIETGSNTHGAPSHIQEELKNNINPYVKAIKIVAQLLQGGIHEIERDGDLAKELYDDSASKETNKLREEAAAGLAAVDVAEKLYEGLESNLKAIIDENGSELKEMNFPQGHGENWLVIMKEFLQTFEGERKEFVKERERFQMIMREELGLGQEEIDEMGKRMESKFVDQISSYKNVPNDVKNLIK